MNYREFLESEGFRVVEYRRVYNKGNRYSEKRSSVPLYQITKGDFSVRGLNSSGLKKYSQIYVLGKNSQK